MNRRFLRNVLFASAVGFGILSGPSSAQETASFPSDGAAPTSVQHGWRERDTLTGDWSGKRSELRGAGVMIDSRLSQFYQGFVEGDDANSDFKYGGKLDFQVRTDLSKFGFWDGLSFMLKGELNYGQTANGTGGVMVPVNSALAFPGMDGADAFDITNFYFGQKFGDSVSVVFGKMNMIDFASTKPFMGGAGIDGFWNTTFTAPPSGLVPPYLFGVIMSARTDIATYGLWIYDPNDVVNTSGLENPFADGVTIRANVDFQVTFAGLDGHQGFTALYSTYPGTDLESPDLSIPPYPPGSPNTKDSRNYFAYSFDQKLYQAGVNSTEGIGIFGQFGISDGNPTRLYWSALGGISGRGMIPGRSEDNWGIAYYYDRISPHLTDALALIKTINDERGFEAFYNFALAPSVTFGTDLQIIEPAFDDSTAMLFGLRLVTTF